MKMRIAMIAATIVALLWVLAARMLGPCDLWDQSQPLTVSYTTDMLVNGNWMLPRARGTEPATKPPLYNWLAVPAVKAVGFEREFGHKLPSVLALVGCVLLIIATGRRGVATGGVTAGCLAAVLFLATYPIFKLGYLARPDMLLTFWLLLAWWSGTTLLINGRPTRGLQVVFWSSVALAGMTKGPPALVAIIHAIFAGRVLCGTWRAGVSRTGCWWGFPLALLINGAWLFVVWRIDPQHMHETIWGQELLGRVTGSGTEGARQGPIELLTGILDMPAYFMIRFAPWSVLSVIAIVLTIRRWRHYENTGNEVMRWRLSATIFVLSVVVVMTLSAGKRADYLAPAYPMAALLASWFLADLWGCEVAWRRVISSVAVTAVIVTLSILTWINKVEPAAPSPDFSGGMSRFIRDAAVAVDARPAVVRFCWTGETHVQAMLGESHKAGRDAVFDELTHGRPFWVVAGLKTSEPHTLHEWMAMRGDPARLKAVVTSIELPRDRGWPRQMTLYWVEPMGTD